MRNRMRVLIGALFLAACQRGGQLTTATVPSETRSWEGPPLNEAVGSPEWRPATRVDPDREAFRVGGLHICLETRRPDPQFPDSGWVVRRIGGVRARLWRGGRLVAGVEAGSEASGCPLLEAPAGGYSVTMGSGLGPYPVELRRGYTDTLTVRYRVNLGPTGPALRPPSV